MLTLVRGVISEAIAQLSLERWQQVGRGCGLLILLGRHSHCCSRRLFETERRELKVLECGNCPVLLKLSFFLAIWEVQQKGAPCIFIIVKYSSCH